MYHPDRVIRLPRSKSLRRQCRSVFGQCLCRLSPGPTSPSNKTYWRFTGKVESLRVPNNISSPTVMYDVYQSFTLLSFFHCSEERWRWRSKLSTPFITPEWNPSTTSFTLPPRHVFLFYVYSRVNYLDIPTSVPLGYSFSGNLTILTYVVAINADNVYNSGVLYGS